MSLTHKYLKEQRRRAKQQEEIEAAARAEESRKFYEWWETLTEAEQRAYEDEHARKRSGMLHASAAAVMMFGGMK